MPTLTFSPCAGHIVSTQQTSAVIVTSITFSTIIIIIMLLLAMTFLSFRTLWSKTRGCQAHFPELPGPSQHWLPPRVTGQLSASWLHCHPSAESRGPRDPVAGDTCPTLPPLGGQSCVYPFGACLMQTRFPRKCWGQKSQLHLPLHFPFPQICGTSLFSSHVTALCHSSPCIQTSRTI